MTNELSSNMYSLSISHPIQAPLRLHSTASFSRAFYHKLHNFSRVRDHDVQGHAFVNCQRPWMGGSRNPKLTQLNNLSRGMRGLQCVASTPATLESLFGGDRVLEPMQHVVRSDKRQCYDRSWRSNLCNRLTSRTRRQRRDDRVN